MSMRRLLVLLIAAAAAAAAARTVIARRREAIAPPSPTPTAPRRAPEPHVSESPEPATTAPDDANVPDDATVEREVEAQLAANPVTEDADVNVEVRDRIASIEGTAPDPETAQVIADETAHVDGVQGLDNRLRVESEAAAEKPGDDA